MVSYLAKLGDYIHISKTVKMPLKQDDPAAKNKQKFSLLNYF